MCLATPYCSANKTYNNTIIYTAEDEYFPYYLDDYFGGSNLTFINKSSLPDGHTLSNSIEEIYQSSKTELDNELVSISSYEGKDGTVYLAILSANNEG